MLHDICSLDIHWSRCLHQSTIYKALLLGQCQIEQVPWEVAKNDTFRIIKEDAEIEKKTNIVFPQICITGMKQKKKKNVGGCLW